MSMYDENHHLYRLENRKSYYLKLKVGNKVFRQKLGTDIEEARRIRDETITNLQAMLDSGQLDYCFEKKDPV